MKCAELHTKKCIISNWTNSASFHSWITSVYCFTAAGGHSLESGTTSIENKTPHFLFYRSCQRSRLMFVTGTGTVTRNSCVCVDCTAVNMKTAVTSARSVQQLAALYCILQGTWLESTGALRVFWRNDPKRWPFEATWLKSLTRRRTGLLPRHFRTACIRLERGLSLRCIGYI